MTDQQKIIKNKLGLLKLAKRLGDVSRACKVMGYSRDSFYRFKQLYETGGEAKCAGSEPLDGDRRYLELRASVAQSPGPAQGLKRPVWRRPCEILSQ